MTDILVAGSGLLLILVSAFLVSLPLGFAVLGGILLIVGLFVDFSE